MVENMVKKIFPIWILTIFLILGPTAFAAEVTVDYSSGIVTVNGKSEANSMIGIQVLREGIQWEAFENAGYSASMIEYNDQTAADEAGRFSFRFAIGGESADYKAYLAYSMESGEALDIHFIDTEDVARVLQTLNAAARNDDKELFYIELSANTGLFGTATDVLRNTIDFRAASDRLCEYAKSSPLQADGTPPAAAVYHSYIAAEAAREGKLRSLMSYVDDLYYSSELDEWIALVSEKTGAPAHMEAVLNQSKPETLEGFADSMTDAAVLAVIRYSGGYENTQRIMKAFDNYLKIGTLKNSDYKKLAGKNYTSVDELKKAAAGLGGQDSGSRPSGGTGGSVGGIPGGKYEPAETQQPGMQEIKIPFIDIDDVSWANEAITALYDRGLIRGKTAARFYPNDLITREEFVKMVVIAKNLQPVPGAGRFADVPADAWYSGYVNAGVENGLVMGMDDSRFGSGMNISRQDIAVMLYRMAKLPDTGADVMFSDMDEAADYAAEAIAALAENKIISGTDSGRFAPAESATRAEAAKMLYGILDYLS